MAVVDDHVTHRAPLTHGVATASGCGGGTLLGNTASTLGIGAGGQHVAAMEASEISSRAQCTRGRRTRVQAEADEGGILYTATANSSVRSAAAAKHRGERELQRGAAIGSAVLARRHDEPRAGAGGENGRPIVAAALG
jgi:hypothetical protein